MQSDTLNTLSKTLSDFPSNKCIAVDAEFAEGIEMLELSVIDAHASLIYNSRFKPRTLRRWRSDIHGITPAMVAGCPSFADCRSQVQSLFDRASYVVGFAVDENDLEHLRREGIAIDSRLVVLELRDWFWLIYGRHNGCDYRQGINLEFCCQSLGIDITEGTLHSAAFDAEISLRAFDTLLRRFVESNNYIDLPFDAVVEKFFDEYRPAKDAYDREQAAGWCSIFRTADRYIMKFNRQAPVSSAGLVASVHVADRKKANVDMSQRFLKKVFDGSFKFDHLSQRNLDFFNSYKNEYSPESHDFNNALIKMLGRMNRPDPRRR